MAASSSLVVFCARHTLKHILLFFLPFSLSLSVNRTVPADCFFTVQGVTWDHDEGEVELLLANGIRQSFRASLMSNKAASARRNNAAEQHFADIMMCCCVSKKRKGKNEYWSRKTVAAASPVAQCRREKKKRQVEIEERLRKRGPLPWNATGGKGAIVCTRGNPLQKPSSRHPSSPPPPKWCCVAHLISPSPLHCLCDAVRVKKEYIRRCYHPLERHGRLLSLQRSAAAVMCTFHHASFLLLLLFRTLLLY
jgi:hypothetical protein